MSDTANNGLFIDRFTDARGIEHFMENSISIGGENHLWIGCRKADPRKLSSSDRSIDSALEEKHCPNDFERTIATQMLLSQSEIAAILPALQHFAEHGYLPLR